MICMTSSQFWQYTPLYQWGSYWISRHSFTSKLIPIMKIYKDMMVSRSSHLYHGNPYTGKTVSLYWLSPQQEFNKSTLISKNKTKQDNMSILSPCAAYFCPWHKGLDPISLQGVGNNPCLDTCIYKQTCPGLLNHHRSDWKGHPSKYIHL